MKKRLPEALRASSALFVALFFLLFVGQPLHAAAVEENGTYAYFDGLRVHYVDEGPRERSALVFMPLLRSSALTRATSSAMPNGFAM